MLRVGDTVKLKALADRGQSEFEQRIGSTGTVTSHRILDGSTIGYLVEFDDSTVGWFYEKELDKA